MAKNVYFYMVDLYETANKRKHNYREIKDNIVEIVNNNALDANGFKILDLTNDNGLHYVADIFLYEEDYLFMRVSSQKPSSAFIHRNYADNLPQCLLKDVSEEKEGIEIYTYALLDYSTGIFSIVNQKSAPNHKIINYFYTKYKKDLFMEFLPIPNPQGIDVIYGANKPKISSIEIEVPVPNPEMLEMLFQWKEKDILDVQGNSLKATLKLSGVERRIIIDDEDEAKGVIKNIKDNIHKYNKAKIRAKSSGTKMQDYSFFEENFHYVIEVPMSEEISGNKRLYSAEELIVIYKDRLFGAYKEKKEMLKMLSNR